MVAERDVRIRSYVLWEAAGKPDSQDIEFWLRAEADLEAEARNAPKPVIKAAVVRVPQVATYSAPQRITAARIPPRDRKFTATAAMR